MDRKIPENVEAENITKLFCSELFKNAPAGIALLEPEPPFKILMHNQKYLDFLPAAGSVTGVVGLPVWDCSSWASANEQDILGFVHEVISTGKEMTFKQFILNPAGSKDFSAADRYSEQALPGETWWQWSLIPVFSPASQAAPRQLMALCSWLTNITREVQIRQALEEVLRERTKIEQELWETEGLYRSIGELLPCGVWICDEQGDVLYFSNSFLELIGLSLKECQRDGWMQALLPETRDRTIQHWRDCLKNGNYWDYEYKVNSPRHGIRTVLSRGVPLKDSTGKITKWVGINLDITERKMMEEMLKKDKDRFEEMITERTKELLNAQVQLEKSKRLSDIGMLASIVAHELRNPLAVIKTAAYNIKRKNQNAELLKKIHNIEKKVQESEIIISNLLNYSSLKMPQLAPASLENLLDESVSFLKNLNKTQHVSIRMYLRAIKGLCFILDAHQIKEVFNNVIMNAYQALKENEAGVITVKTWLDEQKVNIEISDNGDGIEEEDLEQVFQPFFTRKPKGTGLGLTICRDIVHLHNGQIFIDSKKGEGTKVTIQLAIVTSLIPVNGKGS